MQVKLKRIYEKPETTDGLRILVDRLWPRGLNKSDAAIDVWAKELAPSSELRKWFDHQDERFSDFARRYRHELNDSIAEIDKLTNSIGDGVATLLYGAKNTTSNHAIVLKQQLENYAAGKGMNP